jgi:hypothetical protein
MFPDDFLGSRVSGRIPQFLQQVTACPNAAVTPVSIAVPSPNLCVPPALTGDDIWLHILSLQADLSTNAAFANYVILQSAYADIDGLGSSLIKSIADPVFGQVAGTILTTGAPLDLFGTCVDKWMSMNEFSKLKLGVAPFTGVWWRTS